MVDKEKLQLLRAIYVIGDSSCLKILFELDRYGEKTFTELKDNLGINPATLSKKLKILTKFSLVAPDRSHDNLRVFYSLHEYQRPVKRILDSIERLATDL
jgi:DNA-binding HxlR family transcriptional regulator